MDARPRQRPLLLRALIGFWRLLTWLRTAAFNVLFLILLLIVIALAVTPTAPPLPAQAPLLVAPSGNLVDQFTYRATAAMLLDGGGAGAETRVSDLVEAIDYAGHDDRVTGLLLQLDFLQGGSISKLSEIGQAILRFKNSGKPVIAFADNFTQQQYFLATYADEIHLHNMGNVLLTGFGLYRNYFKDALDKLAVNLHVFRVGEFKDFVEPYTRNDMSAESRESNRQWLEEMWQGYTQQVESLRGLPEGALETFINDWPAHVARTGGDTAQALLGVNLVDHVSNRIERNSWLADRFGSSKDNREYLHIPLEDYRSRVAKGNQTRQAQIGLIVASGTILDGFQPDGTIGGDSLSALIRQVRQDDSLKALVLRIDSGGGSAFASEIIRQELEATRAAGKPVVVSMGSVAASGGYWMAMAADEVWATPQTLTGSIGVFGVFPTVDGTLAKLGIHTDGFGTTALNGPLRPDVPLPPLAGAVIQQNVESIYQRFIGLVADSRQSTPEDINEVAQGRVWTGARAESLGLVDKLGYLQDAVASAAELAQLPSSHVRLIERELSPQERLVRQLTTGAEAVVHASGLTPHWAQLFAPGLGALGQLLQQQPLPLDGRAPGFTYAICLECVGI